LRIAEHANQELDTARELHRQEMANEKRVAAALREQLQVLEERLSAREKMHSREVGNLQQALEELQINVQTRERYHADWQRGLRCDVTERDNVVEDAQLTLTNKQDSLHRVTHELDRVYSDYASMSRQAERAIHQRDATEHERAMLSNEVRGTESAIRYERQQRCAEIQQEKMEAVYHMREKLCTAHNDLLQSQQAKVQTASVLGVVCDESRFILSTRDQLEREKAMLQAECDKQNARLAELLEDKTVLASTLMERNEEAKERERLLKEKERQITELQENLQRKGEFIDDMHFALKPKRL